MFNAMSDTILYDITLQEESVFIILIVTYNYPESIK